MPTMRWLSGATRGVGDPRPARDVDALRELRPAMGRGPTAGIGAEGGLASTGQICVSSQAALRTASPEDPPGRPVQAAEPRERDVSLLQRAARWGVGALRAAQGA